jgi:serine/threonine protein kinase
MGVVYRAHDEKLDRDVALKVLPPGTLADESVRKKFRKEALALAQLNHPNIETIYEFADQDGVDFLVMELIPGHALNDKSKQVPLPLPEVARLGIQLADGLAAAHDRGIIHCDLKPHNLILTPDGRLKILDFGLARRVPSRNRRRPDPQHHRRNRTHFRHRAVHVARTIDRPKHRRAQRYFFRRRGALRNGHRPARFPADPRFAAHRRDPASRTGSLPFPSTRAFRPGSMR